MSTPSSKTRRGKDMESSRTSLPHTPSESEDETLDAIGFLFEEIHVPSQEDPVPLIKSRLRHAAEHVTVGQFGNNLVYANSGGHGFLDQIEQMKSEISTLIAKDEQRAGQIDGHRRQIDEHQKHISSLESRVRHLVQTSEGYLSIRKRFLDVYKRDVKGIEELKGSKAIREGNVKAHEGDALGDALLFERDQRTDRSIYRELYGLEHQQVLDFHSKSDDGGMFLILNAHATMVAQGKTLPNDLKLAFDSFLAKVEDYWLQSPTKEPNSPLGSAYYTFWRKFNEQAQKRQTANKQNLTMADIVATILWNHAPETLEAFLDFKGRPEFHFERWELSLEMQECWISRYLDEEGVVTVACGTCSLDDPPEKAWEIIKKASLSYHVAENGRWELDCRSQPSSERLQRLAIKLGTRLFFDEVWVESKYVDIIIT